MNTEEPLTADLIRRIIFVKVDNTLHAPEHPSIVAAADEIMRQIEQLRIRLRSAEEALKKFSELGVPFVKCDAGDTSSWLDIPDKETIVLGATDFRWNRIAVGSLRAAAHHFERYGGA